MAVDFKTGKDGAITAVDGIYNRFFELEIGLLKLMKSSFTVEIKGPVITIKLNGN